MLFSIIINDFWLFYFILDILKYLILGYFQLCETIVDYFWQLKAISSYVIIGYFTLYYHTLFVAILLVPIVIYSINGYWWLFYWWL